MKAKFKMLFRSVQKNLSILGIARAESARSFRTKVLIGCLLLGTNIIMHLKYLFGEAHSILEYSESIFTSSITVMGLWCYASLLHKREKLLEFIDKCETLLKLFRESKFYTSNGELFFCKWFENILYLSKMRSRMRFLWIFI